MWRWLPSIRQADTRRSSFEKRIFRARGGRHLPDAFHGQAPGGDRHPDAGGGRTAEARGQGREAFAGTGRSNGRERSTLTATRGRALSAHCWLRWRECQRSGSSRSVSSVLWGSFLGSRAESTPAANSSGWHMAHNPTEPGCVSRGIENCRPASGGTSRSQSNQSAMLSATRSQKPRSSA